MDRRMGRTLTQGASGVRVVIPTQTCLIARRIRHTLRIHLHRDLGLHRLIWDIQRRVIPDILVNIQAMALLLGLSSLMVRRPRMCRLSGRHRHGRTRILRPAHCHGGRRTSTRCPNIAIYDVQRPRVNFHLAERTERTCHRRPNTKLCGLERMTPQK